VDKQYGGNQAGYASPLAPDLVVQLCIRLYEAVMHSRLAQVSVFLVLFICRGSAHTNRLQLFDMAHMVH
jgi:hypothetical protein